jgi:hypothetical protein
MPSDPLARAITVIRGGLGAAGAAAVLVALSPLGAIVTGPGTGPGAEHTAGTGAPVAAIAGIAAAAILAAAAVPILWAHLAALVLGTGVALMAALLVIAARASDGFADGARREVEGGGVLLVAGFWLALAGIVVALVGVRMVAQAPPVRLPGTTLQRARTAPLAAVLGIAGVVVVVTSALAVAYGTLALGDIRSSQERLSGRGMAIAGVVLGVLVLSLLAAVGGVGAWV